MRRRRWNGLIDLLALKPGMTVAEIGAGRGEMTLHMARKLGADSRVYSTELNPEREDEIREAVEEAGLTDVTVLAAGKTETNLPPASCDAIFMSKVYHHFTEPRRINHSLYETLRPGGALTIIDF